MRTDHTSAGERGLASEGGVPSRRLRLLSWSIGHAVGGVGFVRT